MRIVAHVEPTKHVINMVEFAELVLREARDRGLLATRRRYKRRTRKSRVKKAVTKAPSAPKKAQVRARAKKHPLAPVDGAA